MHTRATRKQRVLCASAALLALSTSAHAMHISEGILPLPWASLWFVVALPFVAWGLRELRIRSDRTPGFKPLIGLVGAAVFIMSCMPVPVPGTGTCAHPCGTGLAAVLVGPQLTVVLTSIALLLQALFLAHGGLSTLGANTVSMGIAGAFVGYGAFWLARRLNASILVAAFLAGLLSDWATYTLTSVELAAGLHGKGSFLAMAVSILVAFAPTQVPLGILEGLLSAGAIKFIKSRRPELLKELFRSGGK